MSNFYKQHLNRLFSSFEFRLILCYLFLGTIFTIFTYSGLNYFQIFLNQMIDQHFLSLFVYPSFIALFFLNFKYINENTNLLVRLKDRKAYVKVQILSMILSTTLLFVQLILIVLIFCNILYQNDLEIIFKFGYNISGYILIILALFKVFLTIILLGLITIFLLAFLKKKTTCIIIISFVLGIIMLGLNLYTNNIVIDFFNIAFHSHGIKETTNIEYIVLSDFIYFTATGFLFLFLNYRIGKKIMLGNK